MGRAAVYLRVSTDKQDLRNSVARQLAACRTWAAAHEMTILEDHIYRDEAISGTTLLGRRGLQDMLANLDAKGRPPFDAVLIDDAQRIERAGKLAEICERFAARGVQLIAVDSGRDLADEDEALLMHVQSGLSQRDVLQIARRTRNGLAQRVLRGYHAGGKLYGYRYVPEWPKGFPVEQRTAENRLGVRIEIEKAQAAVVRELFTRHARGDGFATLASDLNRRGIPTTRGGVWDQSAIRALLTNPKFAGDWSWNKTRWKKRPESTLSDAQKRRMRESGHHPRQRLDRPVGSVVEMRREDLRIIPDQLWLSVQAKFTSRQGTKTRAPSASPLSGLMRCSCGGPIVRHGGSTARGPRLACSWAVGRGATVCANRRGVNEDVILAAIVGHVGRILDPAKIRLSRKTAAAAMRRAEKQAVAGESLEQLQSRARSLEHELGRLTDALAAGADVQAMTSAIGARRRRLDDVQRRIAARAMAGVPEPWAMPSPEAIARDLAAVAGTGEGLRGILVRIVAEIVVIPTAEGWNLKVRTRPWAAGDPDSSPRAGSGGRI